MKTCPICDTPYPDVHATCPTDGAVLLETRELAPGKIIRGKYRIVGKLGHGGMGVVYLAEHLLLGGKLALKFLSHALSQDPQFVRRFRNEARAAYQLRQANIVEVIDLDQAEDGSLFIAMEYVAGPSLRAALRETKKPIPIVWALQIARGLAAGLAAAHARGAVHRDIKPENIVLLIEPTGSVQPKILDFGIAAMADNITNLSRTHGLLLTPEYAAPEQWRGTPANELDGRTDLYALGGVLYETLAGRKPFHAVNPEGWMFQHLQGVPDPLGKLRPDLVKDHPRLEAIIMRMLARDREQRPTTAEQVIAELDEAQSAALPKSNTSSDRTPTKTESDMVSPVAASRIAQGPAPSHPAHLPSEDVAGDSRGSETGKTRFLVYLKRSKPALVALTLSVSAILTVAAVGFLDSWAARMLLGEFIASMAVFATWRDWRKPALIFIGLIYGSLAFTLWQAEATLVVWGWFLVSAILIIALVTIGYRTGYRRWPLRLMLAIALVVVIRLLFEPIYLATVLVTSAGNPNIRFVLGSSYLDNGWDPSPLMELLTHSPYTSRYAWQFNGRLPSLYRQGVHSADPARGVAMLVPMCENGFGRACGMLGYYYSTKSKPLDSAKAAEFYQRHCRLDTEDGCTNLMAEADNFLSGLNGPNGIVVAKDEAHAARLFASACNFGFLVACVRLGTLYEMGTGVTKDYSQARLLYQKACDGGSWFGCEPLGPFYEYGMGGNRDYQLALAIYRKGCDLNVPKDCFGLGTLFESGFGVTMNHPQALALYQQACSSYWFDAESCYRAGLLYQKGLGTAQSYERARDLFQKSCSHGDNSGCISLRNLK